MHPSALEHAARSGDMVSTLEHAVRSGDMVSTLEHAVRSGDMVSTLEHAVRSGDMVSAFEHALHSRRHGIAMKSSGDTGTEETYLRHYYLAMQSQQKSFSNRRRWTTGGG